MKRFIQYIISVESIPFWGILLVQALVWSRFLLSVSLWGMSIVTVLHLYQQHGEQAWSVFKQKIKESSVFWILSLPFFIVLMSGLWSEDLGYWLSRVRIRLPYLIMPIIFSLIPPLSIRGILSICYGFIGALALNMVLVLVNFAFDSETIIQHLGQGRPMPFLKAHIVYSLLTAFAVMLGWELWQRKEVIRYSFERHIIGYVTIFLFIGLHIISVRSGLIALYVCLFLKSVLYLFKYKKYGWSIGILSVILILPFIAYTFLPSLQYRINYAIWDIEHYAHDDAYLKSDSERIISYRMAWAVTKDNLLLGVGAGDLMNSIGEKYAQFYLNFKVKEPHNNFLFVWLSTGLLGLGVFVFSFFYPLFYKKNYRSDIFLLFSVVMFVSLTVDYIIEGTFGAFFYTFFVCLFLKNAFFLHENT